MYISGDSTKKKKETCPDGSKDENVFDIQQGVAIFIAVKKKGLKKKIVHSDLWGLRETKYEWLKTHHLHCTKWKHLKPESQFYFFVPRDKRLLGRYNKYTKMTDIFPENSVGVVTARDNLTIKMTEKEMWDTVLRFANMDSELARRAYNLGKDVRDWKVKLAQQDIKDSELDKKKIVSILYRPFDIRFTYYTGKSRGFHCMPRPNIMRHMLRENIALCVGRAGQVVGTKNLWNIAFCSDCLQDFNLFYRGGNVNFPLYLYPNADLFNGGSNYQREINISAEIFEKLNIRYGRKVQPEQIFYYIYAVLYSNIYRQKYAEFLKTDFPKIPFCGEYGVFFKMSKLGQELINLHLMKSDKLNKPTAKFEGKGNNLVEKVHFDVNQQRVYINADSYFGKISPEIWQYQIGGYQVMDKWLKDRKGDNLDLESIKHYCKIAAVLKETVATQKKIDIRYNEVEANLPVRLVGLAEI